MEKPILKLSRGELFKFNHNQRKWRVFQSSILLPDRSGIPKEDRGKLLVMYDNCKQVSIATNEKVIIQD